MAYCCAKQVGTEYIYRVLKKWRINAILHYSGLPPECGKNVKKILSRVFFKIWMFKETVDVATQEHVVLKTRPAICRNALHMAGHG